MTTFATLPPIIKGEGTMDEEKWLPIPGYEGVYEVSNHGRIKRVLKQDNTFEGRILKGGDYHGYKFVQLSKNNVKAVLKIHRLVAAAFIGKPTTDKYNINHIDGNPSNNHVSNLEYVSQKENVHHALKNELVGGHITDKDTTLKIYQLLQQTNPALSYTEISKRLGVNTKLVSLVAKAESPLIKYRGIHPTNDIRRIYLRPEDHEAIKDMYFNQKKTLTEIAAIFGVNFSRISRIKNGLKGKDKLSSTNKGNRS